MKTPTFPPLLQTGKLGFIVTLASAMFCGPVHAGLQIPYTPDANTLHLWHLDDPDNITATDAVTTASITLNNVGLPNPGQPTNAHLGSVSFPGQGTCLRATTKPHLLFGGTFPNVSQFCNPESGAFTFEAILRVDAPFNPLDAEIVSGDNGGGITTRGWQWRLFNGVMEWDLLAFNTDNDFKSTLPTTGPNAAISNTWYHAAVTYTGYNPTNGDSTNILTFYWTLLDANRTAADMLGQFTATRDLSGGGGASGLPFGQGTCAPNLGVAGSGRGPSGTNPGNNEGLLGSIDEVRISQVALHSNQMAFVVGGTFNPPSVTRQPPTNTLVGYGQTLTVPALISGTPPLSFQWRQSGTNVAGQTTTTLLIPGAIFANGGSYQLLVTNTFGSITTAVAQVTIGAAPTGLFNTGLDTNGVISTGDIPDPHWTLYRSANANDQSYLGPDALIYEYAAPIQFADPNGSFSPTNGVSMWIGLGGNAGGATVSSPVGQYLYRARILLDSADPATVSLSGNVWVNGNITNILVNGVSTPVTQPQVGTLYVAPFTVPKGFKAGWNTLDFVENLTGAGPSAVRVEISGVGQALPPGLPSIFEQPADHVVRDGSVGPNSMATFSVAALGRPPLTYQWRANGTPLAGATNRTLTFVNPTVGAQGTNFAVVVSNDSGSVTSRVATLTLVPTNQPPLPAPFSFVAFQGGTFTLWLSDIVQMSTDPDGDRILFNSADSSSTNGASVQQIGAALAYTPIDNYVGADQFGYNISDTAGATADGLVKILALSTPTNVMVAPGGSASFSVGLVTAPAGYSFQWQLNGTNIAGATTGQLAIPNAQLANSGSYVLAVTDPVGQIWLSPIAGLTVGIPGTGTGLTGDYYGYADGTTNFTGLPTLTQLDPTIDFNWGTAAPDPSLPVDGFQIRWHGQVQPIFSDLYTFSTTTDDGSRLWVNGQLLVNRWANGAATKASGTIQLVAGQKYDILMEYYDNTSTASAQLSWSSVHQPPQVIGTTQLYPSIGLVTPVLSATLSGANPVINWAGTFTLQTASSVTGPWSAVVNSGVGPYTVPLGAGQKAFYRLVDPISP